MKLIVYTRVSTERQGQSGLGLEAQDAAIARYVTAVGGEVTARYVEVESGKRADRPELAKALAHAKRIKGRLVVAKLDRLARNVAFVSALMESGVDFVACDNPHANRLTIHILAAVAEDEARRISERTRAALAAAKARGVKLGSARPGHWDGHEAQRRAGALVGGRVNGAKFAAVRSSAEAAAMPILASLAKTKKRVTVRNAGMALDAAGVPTPCGAAKWHPRQVRRMLDRMGVPTARRLRRLVPDVSAVQEHADGIGLAGGVADKGNGLDAALLRADGHGA